MRLKYIIVSTLILLFSFSGILQVEARFKANFQHSDFIDRNNIYPIGESLDLEIFKYVSPKHTGKDVVSDLCEKQLASMVDFYNEKTSNLRKEMSDEIKNGNITDEKKIQEIKLKYAKKKAIEFKVLAKYFREDQPDDQVYWVIEDKNLWVYDKYVENKIKAIESMDYSKNQVKYKFLTAKQKKTLDASLNKIKLTDKNFVYSQMIIKLDEKLLSQYNYGYKWRAYYLMVDQKNYIRWKLLTDLWI